MKGIVTLVASHLNTLRGPYLCSVLLFLLIASVGSARAQSTERDNPTHLTSSEISGVIDRDSRKVTYYYTFVAGPGEVKITLTVDPGQEYNLNSVSFELFDEDARSVANNSTNAYLGKAGQVIERVNFKRRQRVVLGVQATNGNAGNYRLRLTGTVDVAQDKPAARDSADKPASHGITQAELDADLTPRLRKILPKHGILRVQMKDGSLRKIDLSEVQDVIIEH